MHKEVLLEKLGDANDAVDAAEKELERLLSEITITTRSEKSIVTAAVKQAFSKLTIARAKLTELKDTVEADPDDKL